MAGNDDTDEAIKNDRIACKDVIEQVIREEVWIGYGIVWFGIGLFIKQIKFEQKFQARINLDSTRINSFNFICIVF
jgi:hypothetical protein